MTSNILAVVLSATLALPPALPTTFAYDALSRRTKLTRFNSVESQATYDATNRLLELKHVKLPYQFVWSQPSTWLSALASLFGYGLSTMDYGLGVSDAHAAPPTVSAVRPIQLPPDVLATVTYTYDNVGNRLSAVGNSQMAVGSSQTYGYDPLSQLQSVTGAQTHGYQYDPVGNRQLADGTSYTPNTLNQYSQVGSTSYAYDPNGNLTTNGMNTYAYDAENHLISAAGSFGTASYIYDAFGRRIAKTVNGTTTHYTWDGDQLLEERNAAGTQLAEYVNGPGIDEPLRMQRGTTKTYFLADGLGSITHLTNKDGQVIEQYTYDPYGKPSIFDGAGNPLMTSAFGNRYLFTGREYDQETSLYHYRARTYNALLGRFHQRDPLYALLIATPFFRGVLANPYLYVSNNPSNWIDPLGLYDSPWGPPGNAGIEWLISNEIDKYIPGLPEETKKKVAKALREEMTEKEWEKLKNKKTCQEEKEQIVKGVINKAEANPDNQALVEELKQYLSGAP